MPASLMMQVDRRSALGIISMGIAAVLYEIAPLARSDSENAFEIPRQVALIHKAGFLSGG